MTPLATLTLNATTLKLSDPLTATLTVTGLGPLVVPPPALTVESGRAWSIAPAGPPKVEKLFDGEERWTQAYRLDPFAVGENVPVEFAPLAVTSGGQAFTLAMPGQSVAVSATTQGEAATTLRPAAGPEPLPATAPATGVPFALVYLAVAVVVIAAAAVRAWRRRPVPTLSPVQLLIQDLEALQVGAPTTADELVRLARRLGGFVVGRDITTETTASLATHSPEASWLIALQQLDARRFAGETLSDADAKLYLSMMKADATGLKLFNGVMNWGPGFRRSSAKTA